MVIGKDGSFCLRTAILRRRWRCLKRDMLLGKLKIIELKGWLGK